MTLVKSAPAVARARFERDMKIVVRHRRALEWGWELEPDYGGLRLYVNMWALDEGGNRLDDYHIDMDMSYYPDHPPGVTFVNPETRSFEFSADVKWFPRWGSTPPHIKICVDLSPNPPGDQKVQVLRNTMFLNFYLEGRYEISEGWSPDRNTFFATLHVLQQLLTRPHYEGRSQ